VMMVIKLPREIWPRHRDGGPGEVGIGKESAWDSNEREGTSDTKDGQFLVGMRSLGAASEQACQTKNGQQMVCSLAQTGTISMHFILLPEPA